MGCHFLLQGFFSTEGSNPYLLHWQEDSLPLSHQGSPAKEYYLAIKKNELTPFATTQMSLQIVILIEKSQTEKDRYDVISLICGIVNNGTNEVIHKIGIETQT